MTRTTLIISPEKLAEKIETKLQKAPGTIVININKAKLEKNNALKVDYKKTVTRLIIDHEGNEVPYDFESSPSEPFNHFAHPDLLLALDLMRSHLVILTDQREAYDKKGNELSTQTLDDTPNLISNIKVTGFEIDGGTITINGYKMLKGKRILQLTATQDFYDSSDEPYLYTEELEHVAGHASKEVQLYLNGKMAISAQTKLDFENAEQNEEPE